MVSDVTLTMPDGEVFVGKNKETDEKIQSIIGLDYKQFGKIVMIAQGQFRELIMESTKNRKEIFKSIFSMDIYEKIDLRACVKAKKSEGSTSFESVEKMLADASSYLRSLEEGEAQ